MIFSEFILAATLVAASPAAAVPSDTTPIACDSCDGWNAPHAPFRLHGESYYVGVEGISAVLIATSDGLVLLDGGLPQSVAPISANIRALGYRVEDIKWILVSHAHYDHAGGVAALARLSGAKVATSTLGAQALRAGAPPSDDPQGTPPYDVPFPAVKAVVEIADGGTIRLGDVVVTAHYTPGHTPGGTTWTWRSCEKARCLDLVYADSLNPVSSDDFRFTADGGARIAQFRRSIDVVHNLRCDLLVSVHPNNSNLFERVAARTPKHDALVDPSACKTYASTATQRVNARVQDEAKAAPAKPAPHVH